jgi:radical SAM-linked protein
MTMRVRIKFAKTGSMRYTGHLDLHRAWERCFRRAGLPLAYSQGYNPRPRLNLASALPLGFTSQAELLDARLEQALPIEEIQAALQRALPPGLRLYEVNAIDPRAPALQAELRASEYEITFLEPFPDLAARCAELCAAEQLIRQRRRKKRTTTYDLRPLILELRPLPDDDAGQQRIFARLAAREAATGRPDELLAALGAEPEAARVHRTRLIFETEV